MPGCVDQSRGGEMRESMPAKGESKKKSGGAGGDAREESLEVETRVAVRFEFFSFPMRAKAMLLFTRLPRARSPPSDAYAQLCTRPKDFLNKVGVSQRTLQSFRKRRLANRSTLVSLRLDLLVPPRSFRQRLRASTVT